VHEAAAVIAYLSPGMRFFHQGQLEGRKKRISPHLVRAPDEPVNPRIDQFYRRLLGVLCRPVVRQGQWQLIEPSQAWDGNWTSDSFVAGAWQGAGEQRLLVAVNYAPNRSQCWLRPSFAGLSGRCWRLKDLLGDAVYEREGDELAGRGLYLDVAPWQYHVFELAPAAGRVTP
jgi:hypothetical protein